MLNLKIMNRRMSRKTALFVGYGIFLGAWFFGRTCGAQSDPLPPSLVVRPIDHFVNSVNLRCKEDSCPENIGVMYLHHGNGSLSRCHVTAIGPKLLLTAGHCLRNPSDVPISTEKCRYDVRAKLLNGKQLRCTQVHYVSQAQGAVGFSEDIAVFSVDSETNFYALSNERPAFAKSHRLWALFQDEDVADATELFFSMSRCKFQGGFGWALPVVRVGLTGFSECGAKQGSSGGAIFDDKGRVSAVVSAGMGRGMTPPEFETFQVKLKTFYRSQMSPREAFSIDMIRSRYVYANEAMCIDKSNLDRAWNSDKCFIGVSDNEVNLARDEMFRERLAVYHQDLKVIHKKLFDKYAKISSETGVSYYVFSYPVKSGLYEKYIVYRMVPSCFDDEAIERLGLTHHARLRMKSFDVDKYLVSFGLNDAQSFKIAMSAYSLPPTERNPGDKFVMCSIYKKVRAGVPLPDSIVRMLKNLNYDFKIYD